MYIDRDAMSKKIENLFADIYSTQNDNEKTIKIVEDTVLLDSGLDSLGFAILVTRLEEELGFDPFSISEEPYYPTTFGEFLDFYFTNQPK